jgi:O-antigen/teichoic acid export membrane protein
VSLKRNVIANYLGQGWTALMGLAFIPVYIKYLGIEAYGLIGIFALLQAWLSLLDMGMTPALSREMARFTGGAHNAQSIRNLLRSVEIIGFSIAILVASGIWAASGWLASDWLKTEKLPVDVVAQAFAIMGFVTALRFIENIYRSSIAGLQQQVLLNVILSVMATIRWAGAVGVLVWVSPTIEAFFIWQGLVSTSTIILFATALYTALPPSLNSPHFSLLALMNIWRFAAGMIGITLLSLLLTQVDKILLSRLLPLQDFGYYILAGTVANALYLLAGPISQALYPRFTELVARSDETAIIEAYHNAAQFVSVLMGSAAVVLIFFGDIVMALWTSDLTSTSRSATLVAILALGTLLHGLMGIPYLLQLAYGWTSLATRINAAAIIFVVPAIFFATSKFGAIGAAWVWVILTGGYVMIGIHFMYRRLLVNEKWRWYGEDVGMPLAAAAVTAGLMRWVIPSGSLGWIGQFIGLVMVSIVVLLTASMAAPMTRAQIISRLSNFRRSLLEGA